MNENACTGRDFLKAAGAAVATAVASKTNPRNVDIAKVQTLLKKQGAYLG